MAPHGTHRTARAGRRAAGRQRWRSGACALGVGAWLCLALPAAAHDPRSTSAVPDARALPLRDGQRSMQPQRDHVMSCKTDFSQGRGAVADGAWLQGSTWDATRKLAVQGEVWWSEARFAVHSRGASRQLQGNGLPTDHATGVFPVQRSDPAWRYDPNPNAILAQTVEVELPLQPVRAERPTCLPMGAIGVMKNGVVLFNALDTRGQDALAHEIQDRCGGHPERTGLYHYHAEPVCMQGARAPGRLLGYAMDGFGIYSATDRDGRELTNADLDECHGRVARVLWDGREVEMYHYVLTREYPYTLGCFRGRPVRNALMGGGTGPNGVGGPAGPRGTEEAERGRGPAAARPQGPHRPPPPGF